MRLLDATTANEDGRPRWRPFSFQAAARVTLALCRLERQRGGDYEMSGAEPFLLEAFAAVQAGAEAVGSAAASIGETAVAAAPNAVTGVGTAVESGVSAVQIGQTALTAASLAGTGAQLLQKPPGFKIPKPPTQDDAQREANMRADLLRRRGRSMALLNEGGAAGLSSTPSLGASALLGQ